MTRAMTKEELHCSLLRAQGEPCRVVGLLSDDHCAGWQALTHSRPCVSPVSGALQAACWRFWRTTRTQTSQRMRSAHAVAVPAVHLVR